jgi:hypothetical protein
MLLAAFARAHELGIESAFVERVLRAQLAPPPAVEKPPSRQAAKREGK